MNELSIPIELDRIASRLNITGYLYPELFSCFNRNYHSTHFSSLVHAY